MHRILRLIETKRMINVRFNTEIQSQTKKDEKQKVLVDSTVRLNP